MTNIYALLDPLTNKIRYVGKANNINSRLYQHLRDNARTHKVSWIKSLNGIKPVLILLDEIEEDEWEFWEIYWISQCKTWGFDLVNHSNGGQGVLGTKHTLEHKNKISNSNKGKKHSEESKKLMSESRKGIIFSETHKQNLSKSHIGLKYNSENYGKHFERKIIQYDKEMNFIREWNSIKEAAQHYKVNYTSISHCCAQRKKFIKGFIWRYKDL